MADLIVVVPSRGRPHTVAEMVEAFEATCMAHRTKLLFAVDGDDPERPAYCQAVADAMSLFNVGVHTQASTPGTMVSALNDAASWQLQVQPQPQAIGFMGDDHRPRTVGWDRAYLDALTSLPGIVYGNDLLQGPNLPTQCAVSTSVVRVLGHMAPPVLTHLYVDNYWRDLGRAAGCITYLPDVVVEHMHPVAGKAAWDEGHRRVNARPMYDRDRDAYLAYWEEHANRDVMALRTALTGAGR